MKHFLIIVPLLVMAIAWDTFGAPREETFFLENALAHFNQGKEYYLELHLERAIEELTLARVSFSKAMPLLKNGDALFETYLTLAKAYLAKGDTEKARTYLKEGAIFSNGKKLSLEMHSPDFIDLYNEVSQSLLFKEKMEISSIPSKANVYLNGSSRGTTPLTLGGLASGTHHILLEMEGHAPVYEKVILNDRGEKRELSKKLAPIVTSTDPLSPAEFKKESQGANTPQFFGPGISLEKSNTATFDEISWAPWAVGAGLVVGGLFLYYNHQQPQLQDTPNASNETPRPNSPPENDGTTVTFTLP